MRALRIAALAAALFGVSPAPAASDVPMAVTIPQLIASPETFRERTVVVRGQVDECVSLTCNLCPEDMTRATFDREKCLGLAFSDFGDPVSWSASRTLDMQDEMFRFATVTLEAQFIPSCLTGKDPSDPKATIVCMDRATVLRDARVREVHARRNADAGLVISYDFGTLVQPGETDRIAMAKVLSDGGEEGLVKFFIAPEAADPKHGREAAGYGCTCRADDCKGLWPEKWAGGFRNFGNAFVCYELEKKRGVWQLLPIKF